MATFAITGANTNIDTLTSKAGDDTYNINGTTASLIIDQDTRYGLNGNTSAVLGNVNPSSTLGGSVKIDGTLIRLIPYDTGTGNVPADGTTISQGSASGILIGVYDTLAVAPTTAGSAMPADGYIKIKQWNSVAYSTGALTGIGANATGADVVGWIEVVGQESRSLTLNRLNNTATPVITGAYYEIGTTGGNRTDTYQIPSNGVSQYHAGVEVETGSGTNVYEHYPCANSITATLANVGTNATQGKWCWIATDGTLRFGHDGTNSTGGYLPPSGRKIRIGNVFCANATSAAKTANAAPNTTFTNRFRFNTSVVGRVHIDHTSCSWATTFTTPLEVNIENSQIMSRVDVARPNTQVIMDNVLIGDTTASFGSQESLRFDNCPKGLLMTNCTLTRGGYSGTNRVFYMNVVDNIEVSDTTISIPGAHSSVTQSGLLLANCNNINFTDIVLGVGSNSLSVCRDLTIDGCTFYATTNPVTVNTNVQAMFTITSCDDFVLDNFDFGGLVGVATRSSVLSLTSAPSNGVIRNWGTESSPLALGQSAVAGASWSRSATTATVTSVAHGLVASDSVFVYICNGTTPIPLGVKTVATVPTADTFTFTATNSGATSGTLSYYPVQTSAMTSVSNGTGLSNIKFQNVHFYGHSGSFYTINGNDANVVFENVSGDLRVQGATPIPRGVENENRSLKSGFYQGITTAVLGTHFADGYVMPEVAGATGVSWSRSSTTATVTSSSHGLYSGALINIASSSDTAAIVDGQPTTAITVLDENTFTFTCLNAGGTSGTLNWTAPDSRLVIYMNEPTSSTSSQVTIDSGTPSFNGFGSLVAFTTGDQVTFETPEYIIGYDSFPNYPLQPIGVSLSTYQNYDFTYAIDTGSGYSSFKNLAYHRAGGGGSASSTTVTMTSTTGVTVNDRVYGTGIATGAYVVSIDSATNITVSSANTKAVTGTLVFNKLPTETIGSDGFKLKVRIYTNSTATQTIGTLSIPLQSDSTSRALLYPQTTDVPLTITVVDQDLNPVENARVRLKAAAGGPESVGAVLLTGLTDSSGELTGTYGYISSQPVTGWARKASGTPYYKEAPIGGTVTSNGFAATAFLVEDE